MTCQVTEVWLLFFWGGCCFFVFPACMFVALCLLCTRVSAACVSVCACTRGNANLDTPLVVCACVRSVRFVLTKGWASSHSGGLRILFLPFWHTSLPINYWHIPIFSFRSHLPLPPPLNPSTRTTTRRHLKGGNQPVFSSTVPCARQKNSREEACRLKPYTLLQSLQAATPKTHNAHTTWKLFCLSPWLCLHQLLLVWTIPYIPLPTEAQPFGCESK